MAMTRWFSRSPTGSEDPITGAKEPRINRAKPVTATSVGILKLLNILNGAQRLNDLTKSIAKSFDFEVGETWAIPGARAFFERVIEEARPNVFDPATGSSMDNVKSLIENIEWLSAEDRKKIFEDNARAVFKLTVQ
jgi:hypothetical protein